ncbi:uncharacterized protein [Aegilops tauschii subsp. strangulata]|uniref:uncharacterized protein isoform X6 n=1 Tax=Aegilops tauschii subsp. strangulata TaxID=200361 RepID=UPI00098A3E16|nr:uncharacterized protein LOC109752524 isoform X7 [Aegilops tauschii subsp. strangulata]XP_045088569.1 uncharacterized protein LOC109752524 isoform X7 [Aegilops tauschii subsp. strangulata]XP_045088571.1 uncharacterized protein LOC109752524 isoform X7 [Aegilops tauschii subsp. strangulata]XP_045088572.1 uncharacterized protein LOC109752524 isoform X7 [Aegilops tauschii subsp. strangulata]
MEDAAPAPPRRHLRDPSRYISCDFDGGSRTARTMECPERPGQPPCEASSVDDDDNQGIHRHDDAPHMVQLGYNLLYRGTKTVALCGIGYNLLSFYLIVQVVVLKVSLHYKVCTGKVKKHLAKMEGEHQHL